MVTKILSRMTFLGMCILLFVGNVNAQGKYSDAPQGEYADSSRVSLWYSTVDQIEITEEDGEILSVGNWLMFFGELRGSKVWIVEKDKKGFRYYAPHYSKLCVSVTDVSQDIRQASLFEQQLQPKNFDYLGRSEIGTVPVTLRSFVMSILFPYPDVRGDVLGQAVSDLQSQLSGKGTLRQQLEVFYSLKEKR